MKFTIRISLMAVLLCGAMVAGCSKSKMPSKVHGTVTYKGNPLPAGTVTFYAPEGGIFPFQIENGEFKGESLPTGKMKVTVDTEALNPKHGEQAFGGDKNPGQNTYRQMMEKQGKIPATATTVKGEYVKLPEKYRDKDKTPLEVDINKGDNPLPPFEIKDD